MLHWQACSDVHSEGETQGAPQRKIARPGKTLSGSEPAWKQSELSKLSPVLLLQNVTDKPWTSMSAPCVTFFPEDLGWQHLQAHLEFQLVQF